MNNSNIYVLCEGKSDSLDFKILEKIKHPSRPFTIVPFGGKIGYKNYKRGFEYALKEFVGSLGTDSASIVFRDRDFDFDAPSDNSLKQIDPNVYVGCRVTIENYLLSPKILYDFIQNEGLPNQRDFVNSIDKSCLLIQEACKALRYYTAARYAHGTLKKQDNNLFAFKSDWPNSSGSLPEDLSDSNSRSMLADVVGDVKRKIYSIDFDVFEGRYSKYCEIFDEAFFNDIEKCLKWFNGKDIAAVLNKKIPGNSIFPKYYDYALLHSSLNIDDSDFPSDLIEFREIIHNSN